MVVITVGLTTEWRLIFFKHKLKPVFYLQKVTNTTITQTSQTLWMTEIFWFRFRLAQTRHRESRRLYCEFQIRWTVSSLSLPYTMYWRSCTELRKYRFFVWKFEMSSAPIFIAIWNPQLLWNFSGTQVVCPPASAHSATLDISEDKPPAAYLWI